MILGTFNEYLEKSLKEMKEFYLCPIIYFLHTPLNKYNRKHYGIPKIIQLQTILICRIFDFKEQLTYRQFKNVL